jgi:hypothetical protein
VDLTVFAETSTDEIARAIDAPAREGDALAGAGPARQPGGLLNQGVSVSDLS